MDIIKLLHVGRFTIAQVKDSETGIEGIGISRKSYWDKYSPETGEQIALGRAMKAVELKKRKKEVHQLLMG
jgi:hypothetical protein